MYKCKYLRFTIYFWNKFLNKYAHIRAYFQKYEHIFIIIRAYKHIIFFLNTRILIPSLVIIVKKYVKMLKSKKFYLLKLSLTWPIEQVRT